MFDLFLFFRGLCFTPRRVVRLLLFLIVALFGLAISLSGLQMINVPQPAHAASVIIVNELVYSDNANGKCNLFEAVRNAYDDAPTYRDCATGNGVDTILFTVEGTIRIRHVSRFPSGWDMIIPNGTLIIDGQGKITLDGRGTNMIADVPPGDSLILKNLTLQNGYSEYGGAVRNFGYLKIERCTFIQNKGETKGGAIFSNDPNAEVVVEDSTFYRNRANRGGAIFNENGQLRVVNSTFKDNIATKTGGGIQNDDDAMITNSTFVGNSASEIGAGIHNQAGSVTVTYSTFANNSALIGSGFNNSASAYLAGVLFRQGNSGSNCRNAGSLVDNGYNFSDDGSCQTFTGTSQRNVPIDLGPLANNGGFTLTRKPIEGSMAIGAIPYGTSIDNNGVMFACNGSTTDQTARLRPLDSGDACTSGAVEVDPPDLYDFGDAPDPSYPTLLASGGAQHLLGGSLFLGASVDSELDGQPTAAANGDNDDGVVFTTPIIPGVVVNVQITASEVGQLNAWLDFNANGSWTEVDEHIFVDRPLAVGVNNLSFTVPMTAMPTRTFARFRLNSGGGLSFTGLAADGEVEDYRVTILSLPEIIVSPTGPLSLGETGTDMQTFNFRLSSQPTGTVTIPVSVSNPSECFIAIGSNITLDATNWNIGYTLVVISMDDWIDDGDLPCNLVTGDPVSTGDSAYNMLTAADSPDVSITVTDDDSAGIAVNPTGPLSLSEIGPAAQTFIFTLDSQPTDTVTIPVSVSSSECQIMSGGTDITLDTFTWKTGYAVTVTAVDDLIDDGDLPCNLVTGDPTSPTDFVYNALTAADSPDVSITVTNGAGITIMPTSGLITTEAGDTASFTIRLTSQPAGGASVTIPLSSSNPSEGIVPALVTVSNAAWSTGTLVTVTGQDDLLLDGDQPYTIITGNPTSTDPLYDALSEIDVADVSITNQDNDTAILSDDDGYSTSEDQTLTVDAASGVLNGDTGGNGNALSALLDTLPTNGTLTIFNTDGSFEYLPKPGFFGTDTFTYHATDGTTNSAPATVTIFVALVNGEIIARDDSGDGRTNTPVTLNVLANDTDPDGDPLHIAQVSAPANGTAMVKNGEITYTSAPGFVGIDSFTYTAADNFGATDTAMVSIAVWQSVPLCADFDGSTNEIIRADVPGGTVTGGSVFCRVLVENASFIQQSAEVGKLEVLNRGVIQAVDVFALLHNGTSVQYFNNPASVCLRGRGVFLYLDATVSPRSVVELPVFTQNGYTCASVPNAGTIVLVTGVASVVHSEPDLSVFTGPITGLSDCMVTTRNILNLRAAPDLNGAIVRLVPYDVTLTALERTSGWYYVDYNGERGWISAGYVTPQGMCAQ